MSGINFDNDFLGAENIEGFNYPISQEKIQILLNEKHTILKHNKNIFISSLLILLGAGTFYLFSNMMYLEQKYLSSGLLFIMSSFFLIFAKKNKWQLIWINFLLYRNNELLTKKQYKILKWKQMIF